MNALELSLSIFFLLFNFIFVTVLLAEMAPLIEELTFRYLARSSEHRHLRNCFGSIHLSKENQRILFDINRYRWRHQYGMEERDILEYLPTSLSMEIRHQFLEQSFIELIRSVLNKAISNYKIYKEGSDFKLKQQLKKIYSNQKEKKAIETLLTLEPLDIIHPGLLRKMANEFEPLSVAKNSIIVSSYIENDYIYFIIDGNVIKYDPLGSNKAKVKLDGYPHFFGENTFLYGEQSKLEYKAETVCSLFRCNAKTFKKMLSLNEQAYRKFLTLYHIAFPPQTDQERDIINKGGNITLRRSKAIELEKTSVLLNENVYFYTTLLWDILNGFGIIYQSYSWFWGVFFFGFQTFKTRVVCWSLVLNWIFDIIYLFDIIFVAYDSIKFFNNYPWRGFVNKKRKSKRKYFIDVLYLIPFELFLINKKNPICCFIKKNKTCMNSVGMMTKIFILRSFKFLRLRQIPSKWTSLVEFLRKIGLRTKHLRAVIISLSVIHVGACIWYFVGSTHTNNWITNDIIASKSLKHALTRAEYWILITLTTIGYGGITPVQIAEIIYTLIVVLIGGTLYWILISYYATNASYQQTSRVNHTNLVSATEFLLQMEHPSFRPDYQIKKRDNDNDDENDNTSDNKTRNNAKSLSQISNVNSVFSNIDDDDEQIDDGGLIVRLHHYFDFVLDHRDGVVSFWDNHNITIQANLKYQFLNAAFESKKSQDNERYNWLESIPHEVLFDISQTLEWVVVNRGQSIQIKQTGLESSIIFLVTGGLYSPYSKKVYKRNAKTKDRINKTNILCFNLECLSPLRVAYSDDVSNVSDVIKTLPTYLQIDVDKAKHEEVFKTLFGIYEFVGTEYLEIKNEYYQIVYQRVPKMDNIIDNIGSNEEEIIVTDDNNDNIDDDDESVNHSNSTNEVKYDDVGDNQSVKLSMNKPKSHIYLVYEYNETIAKMPTISENFGFNESKNDSEYMGDWYFVEYKIKPNGKIDPLSKKIISKYVVDELEVFNNVDEFKSPLNLESSRWSNNNAIQSSNVNLFNEIFITDRLNFQAYDTSDIVQLYQQDVIDIFKNHYPLRFNHYLNKKERQVNRRGSILKTMGLSKKRQSLIHSAPTFGMFCFNLSICI